ncbi:MAG: histidine--tRNA ligase [Candidatus Micrarchaeota archaeon]|nr:histidine--tRNA ligase [Candidatus Micrarchaeota archaeon]
MAEYSAPKGMRDFLPDEMDRRERAIEAIKKIYRKYGFVPMDTPAMEMAEVLEKKCGEEIRGQIFRIDDGKHALRFDLTVPLSRVVSSNTFRKPFKRYCIGPVWRREEPQKGRFREFYQADADIIGSSSMRAEAELIACAHEAISALGFCGATVLLNDRRLAFKIAQSMLPGKESSLLRLLDKRGKISRQQMIEEFAKIGGADPKSQEMFIDFLGSMEKSATEKQRLELAEEHCPEAAESLSEIISLAQEYGRSIKIELDLALVRGMDYYTGPIFEIKLGEGIGSVAGGGRYDGLLGLYGQGDYAVGISLGIERLLSLMKEGKRAKGGVFVACTADEHYAQTIRIASAFRAAGIVAHTDLNSRSLKKQMEFASGCCAFIAIVGEKETAAGKLTLRDLESGKEELLGVEEAIRKVKERLA